MKFFTVVLLFISYILIKKVIRPFVYLNINNEVIFFLVGVLPNFLGGAIVFLTNRILNISRILAVFLTIFLAVFMEIERFFNQKISFDIYDIVATILAVFIFYIMDYKYFRESKIKIF